MAVAKKQKQEDEILLIPLKDLVPSPLNVRKTGGQSIEDLAASIKAEGLLQNLTVIEQKDAKGKKTGKYEVTAGGRRLKALQLLIKNKELPATHAVVCRVTDASRGISSSLAENTFREAMHPADQFMAFKAMADEGKTTAEIAARFGTSELTVERRLKLAKVAPALIETYRADQIKLDQLMALAITDDHKLQLRVWEQCSPHTTPMSIRSMLTQDEIDSKEDLRVDFVGIDAYQAAGGKLRKDLFSDEDQYYLSDSGLLEQLVQTKLSAAANQLREEGLPWVDVYECYDYLHRQNYIHAATEALTPTKKQETRRKQLIREIEKAADEYIRLDDEGKYDETDAAEARRDALSDELRELEESLEKPVEHQAELTGAVVHIGPCGRLSIRRHLLHRPDTKAAARAASSTTGSAAAGEAKSNAEPGETNKLSEKLVMRLTAHRTAAMQAMLAQQPRIALVALTHALVLDHFFLSPLGAAVNIRGTRPGLKAAADDIGESKALTAMAELQEQLKQQLPSRDTEENRYNYADILFSWMLQQPDDLLLQLLAFCVAHYVDTIIGHPEQQPQALRLMPVLGIDMADWWEPTRETYFNHVPKPVAIAAVAEAWSETEAAPMARLKKGELAEACEKRLAGKRWLPAPLRQSASTDSE